MMKQALRSYVASLHPRNIKKLRESMTYAYIYIFCILIYALTALVQDNGLGELYCRVILRVLLPFGLMGWSNLGSKYLMPKAMFLCPMKEEERKEYLNCVLTIKIGAMVLSSLCTELIWSFFNGFRLWEVLLVPFLFFLIGIAEYAGFEVKRDERGQLPTVTEDKHGNRVPIWMNTVPAICAIIALAFITGYEMEMLELGNRVDALMMLGFVGTGTAFAVVFAYIIVKNQYKYVIEQSSDYELHFNIKGKVESPKKYDLFAK